jgi:hypothetical protein
VITYIFARSIIVLYDERNGFGDHLRAPGQVAVKILPMLTVSCVAKITRHVRYMEAYAQYIDKLYSYRE